MGGRDGPSVKGYIQGRTRKVWKNVVDSYRRVSTDGAFVRGLEVCPDAAVAKGMPAPRAERRSHLIEANGALEGSLCSACGRPGDGPGALPEAIQRASRVLLVLSVHDSWRAIRRVLRQAVQQVT